mmetsp:Transcript_16405/g.46977  ORF Transcript_16405/g.46977 Transcript_16405/m.46977 type:complete len:133 (+) Transcript_16405:607-1005(+)
MSAPGLRQARAAPQLPAGRDRMLARPGLHVARGLQGNLRLGGDILRRLVQRLLLLLRLERCVEQLGVEAGAPGTTASSETSSLSSEPKRLRLGASAINSSSSYSIGDVGVISASVRYSVAAAWTRNSRTMFL